MSDGVGRRGFPLQRWAVLKVSTVRTERKWGSAPPSTTPTPTPPHNKWKWFCKVEADASIRNWCFLLSFLPFLEHLVHDQPKQWGELTDNWSIPNSSISHLFDGKAKQKCILCYNPEGTTFSTLCQSLVCSFFFCFNASSDFLTDAAVLKPMP